MRVEAVAEELVRAGAIALPDGAAGVVEGPAGYGDAEGDEGFFFEATGELLPAVFFVKIAGTWSAEVRLRGIDWQTHGSLSKEEGRGASDILDWECRKSEEG